MNFDNASAFLPFSDVDGTCTINGAATRIPIIATFTGDPATGGATLHPQTGEQFTVRILKTNYSAPAFMDKIVWGVYDFSVKQFFSENDFWVLICSGNIRQPVRGA